MQVIRLASETDFAGWRAAARMLRARRTRPDEVIWTVDQGAADLFDDAALEAPACPRRYAERPFSLLTPDACAHWDTRALIFTPGADPADAPPAQGLEDYWRARYAALFAARGGNPPPPAGIAGPSPAAEPCAQ